MRTIKTQIRLWKRKRFSSSSCKRICFIALAVTQHITYFIIQGKSKKATTDLYMNKKKKKNTTHNRKKSNCGKLE